MSGKIKALRITGIIEFVDVENELSALQREVDGWIETITLEHGGVMIVDEEGRLKHKRFNLLATLAAGQTIVGDALIVGQDGEEFSDVPDCFHELLALNERFGKPDR